MISMNHQRQTASSFGVTVPPVSASGCKVKHILAPTDLTEASARAVEYALCLADQLDAELTLFHVWDVPGRVGGASSALDYDRLGRDRELAEQAFYNLYQQTRSRHLATDCFFLAGDPCALVLSAAKTLSIDLIVIASHHRSWLSDLIGRSDIERIARSASCALLTVR
ncbi:MAG: universal stress protein [Chthoniobacterales bacterium]